MVVSANIMFFLVTLLFFDKNITFANMKVVIDDKIPYIREAAASLFDEVSYLPGAGIAPRDVRDADVLIVRTRTRCNEALLAGSRVRCVVTATIGYEHLDVDYLESHHIHWINCPGCNATSVAQYIRNSLIVMKRAGLYNPAVSTLGIVGAGHVGKAVYQAVGKMACRILLNDPPRQQREGGAFVSLEEIANSCDVITFHTPLTVAGQYPSWHLADENFFHRLRRHPIIINAARGGVVDNAAWLEALDSGTVGPAVIDTWENEPDISLPLLEKAFIGTPHIAGYSADGKANATRMALESVCSFFGIKHNFTVQPPALPAGLRPSGNEEECELQLYNPLDDSNMLKASPRDFEKLRGNYRLRREVWPLTGNNNHCDEPINTTI